MRGPLKGRFIEFETTRNDHMTDQTCPYTVSVCFKEPPREFVPEAWRILLAVTKGKQLVIPG